MIHSEFRHQLRQLQESVCPDQRLATMITNISPENLDAEHYCVILDPAYLMFASRDPLSKTVLRYDFEKHLLTQNQQIIPLDHLPDLIAKLGMAIQDIQSGTSRVYSKPSSMMSPKPSFEPPHRDRHVAVPQFAGGHFA